MYIANITYRIIKSKATRRAVSKYHTQCRQIIDIILSNGGSMTRIPLLEAIDRTVESKQEPAQILNKYLSPLKKDGLLKVIK